MCGFCTGCMCNENINKAKHYEDRMSYVCGGAVRIIKRVYAEMLRCREIFDSDDVALSITLDFYEAKCNLHDVAFLREMEIVELLEELDIKCEYLVCKSYIKQHVDAIMYARAQ